MKSILLSTNPKWIYLESIEKKKIEVRKNRPKLKTPFKCLIYCTYGQLLYADYPNGAESKVIKLGDYKVSGKNKIGNMLNGKVIGEFVCDKVYELFPFGMGTGIELFDELISPEQFCKDSCLTEQEICDYIGEKDGYGWHISDLKIYDKPKELSEFYAKCNIPENKCMLCDNCFDREDYYGRHYAVKKLIRPPQSWCYVDF